MTGMITFQVTIPVSGKVQVSSGLPTGYPTDTLVQFLTIQNNSGHNIRYGGANVSSTLGILLPGGTPGGAGTQSTPVAQTTMISDWWLSGTAGDVIDILAIP